MTYWGIGEVRSDKVHEMEGHPQMTARDVQAIVPVLLQVNEAYVGLKFSEQRRMICLLR
jgi:hypothetical protein